MERWRGVLKATINSSSSTTSTFKLAASLRLSQPSQTLAVPSANVVFFHGDRVEGTGDPVVEEMSCSGNVAELMVAKFGETVNAWVVEASTFNGPFAVYKEFVPTVDSLGNPRGYDPRGFPASSSLVKLLSSCIQQVKGIQVVEQQERHIESNQPTSSSRPSSPKTIILGFSKSGVVLNQILTELALCRVCISNGNESSGASQYSCNSFPAIEDENCIFPSSEYSFLSGISQFHYVDVGLNRPGAYLTDPEVIKKIGSCSSADFQGLLFVLHGTPRQWESNDRPWIRNEKDRLLDILEEEARASNGEVEVVEKFYYSNLLPSLKMHFQIIQDLDVS